MSNDRIKSGRKPLSDTYIRGQARKLLLQIWAMRDSLLSPNLSEEQVVRAAPDVIPKLIGFELSKTEGIQSDEPGIGTAGLIDSVQHQILINNRCAFVERRFTLAHEIGHAVLHPRLTHHRDRPLDGSERRDWQRPLVDREADLFAAELLMPTKLLTKVFVRCFQGRIVGDEADQDFCFHLSTATGQRISPHQFARLEPLKRAMLIAGIEQFGQCVFESLEKRFAVSRTAMGIQLLDLGLVS